MVLRYLIRWAFRSERRVVLRSGPERIEPARTDPVEPIEASEIKGKCYVVDGDTVCIRNMRIRLAGIDAPELSQAWGQKSKWALFELCRGQVVTARITGRDAHGRALAICTLPDGRDIGAEMVRQGLALDWPMFSGGRYRHLEPADARRRLSHLHVGQLRLERR